MSSLSMLVCVCAYKTVSYEFIAIHLYVKKTKIFINEPINIIVSELTMLTIH